MWAIVVAGRRVTRVSRRYIVVAGTIATGDILYLIMARGVRPNKGVFHKRVLLLRADYVYRESLFQCESLGA